MTEPRDRELSRVYREGAWPEPRRQLDEAILEASRRAARARRSKSLLWRLGPPFALAAAVVLTFSLLLRTYEEPPPAAPPAQEPKPAPAAGAVATEKAAAGVARADRVQRGLRRPEERPARETAEPLRERQPEAEPAPPPAQAPALSMPTAAAPGAAAGPDVGGAAAADALARSPQAWLEDVRRLKARGKDEDVRRELAEFRKRYPDYPLPDDLR